MNFLNSVITRTKGYGEILNSVMANRLPVEANGLSGVHKAVLISALIKQTEKKAVLITPDEAEAAKLAEDLIAKGENIKAILDNIAERSPLVVKEYTAKLRTRIAELIDGNAQIPEDRILTEAAIFADKCAIDEEITRLNSHLIQLKKILTSNNDAEGKKLDFLVQEMNREANTIGSKANDITITNYMLEIKSEIEKIREQVQNIE